jgi:hypothetical protein
MAIEHHADDTAVQDPVERLVVRLRRPFADDVVALNVALDAQTSLIRRPTAEAAAVRRVAVLEALGQVRGFEGGRYSGTRPSRARRWYIW